jgi:hypothetical protein
MVERLNYNLKMFERSNLKIIERLTYNSKSLLHGRQGAILYLCPQEVYSLYVVVQDVHFLYVSLQDVYCLYVSLQDVYCFM